MEKGLEPDAAATQIIHDVHELSPPKDGLPEVIYHGPVNLEAFAGHSASRAILTIVISYVPEEAGEEAGQEAGQVRYC